MFSPIVRLVLIVLAAALGAREASAASWVAVTCFLSAALLTVGYFRHGTIWLAFRALKSGRGERARSLLATIRWPRYLDRQSRAYYEMMRGEFASEDGDPKAAEAHLREAIGGALRTDQDRCVATCLLAEVLLAQGLGDLARQAIDAASQIPHRSNLDERISALREQVDGATGG